VNPARQLVRDLFKAGRPTWNVIAEPRTSDAILKPTALVWVPKMTRTDYAGGSFVTSTVDLWLLPPSALAPAKLEDTADDMLVQALELVEAAGSVTWTDAAREQLEDTFHGWHLTLAVAHKITTTKENP